jgi:hypothetical protein
LDHLQSPVCLRRECYHLGVEILSFLALAGFFSLGIWLFSFSYSRSESVSAGDVVSGTILFACLYLTVDLLSGFSARLIIVAAFFSFMLVIGLLDFFLSNRAQTPDSEQP